MSMVLIKSCNAWCYALYALTATILNHIVGNKEKGPISKRVFEERKACQNFRKTNIFYPLIRTRTSKWMIPKVSIGILVS